MQQRLTTLLMVVLLAGCASGGARAGGGERPGDPALYTILAEVPLDSAAEAALHAYEVAHTRDFLERISVIAEDAGAGVPARFNAVRILGERRRSAALPSLRVAATDRDPRVRAAVVVAAADIAEATGQGGSLVEAALADPATEVAAKALERLGPEDLEVVRGFVARTSNPELAAMARELIRMAEERGARLAGDSAGVVRRQVTSGLALEFQPTRRWAGWDAAVGTVSLRSERGTVQLDSIEVVRGVVPVFFTADAGRVVYERGRRIYVRDLESGAVREAGAGVAPRLLPFTGDFVYLREIPARRKDQPESTVLEYEVVRAPVAGAGSETVLGTLPAPTNPTRNGGYSPVRWLRVVERNGVFSLEGEGISPFHLPPLFATGTLP